MLKGFDSLKSILKIGSTIVDNKIFALNYHVTALILLTFSIIVTSTQFIGDPIKCVSSKSGDALEKMLDTYCWIQSTYTLPSALNKTVGVQVPYPGVDRLPYPPNVPETVIYHRYYQWVPFVLFLQAVMFYVPHYIWTSFERNRIRNMIMGLNIPVAEDQTVSSKVAMLAEYFTESMGSHRCYTFTYFFCEALNLINIIGQIFFVDTFLGGEFLNYGAQVFQYNRMDQKDHVDPMVKVFPYMTKCMFYMFGPSGDVQKLDALCLLPINVVNEKLYVFMWFWFVIVAIINGLMVLYRIPLLLSTRCRSIELRISHRYVDRGALENYVKKGDIGDWFVLHLLGKNIDVMHFKVLVDLVDGRLDAMKRESRKEEEKLISESPL